MPTTQFPPVGRTTAAAGGDILGHAIEVPRVVGETRREVEHAPGCRRAQEGVRLLQRAVRIGAAMIVAGVLAACVGEAVVEVQADVTELEAGGVGNIAAQAGFLAAPPAVNTPPMPSKARSVRL